MPRTVTSLSYRIYHGRKETKYANTAAAAAKASSMSKGGDSMSSRPRSRTDLSLLAAVNDSKGSSKTSYAAKSFVFQSKSITSVNDPNAIHKSSQTHIPPSARRSYNLSSILVGATDPSVLDHLGAFDAAIFLSPKSRGALGRKVSVAFARVFVSAIARRIFLSELMKNFAISMTIGVMTATFC